MSVKQWIVNLNGNTDSRYPAQAQVRLDWDPDSVAFVHLGPTRTGDNPPPTGDVQICFDEQLPADSTYGSTDPDQLLLSAAAPGNTFSLNDRFRHIFLRVPDINSSAAVQVVVTKAK